MATDSPELTRIAAEALDIAKSAAQEPTTAHLLLATFTVPGAADVLLRERGCDEDRVLEELARARPSEEPGLFLQALERARQLADDCASQRAEGLHLLVALTRLSRSAATALLDRLVNLASLRTTALGEAGHGALEGMRMQVRHAREHRALETLSAIRGAFRLHRADVAAVDGDAHVARPSRGQQRIAREVFFHAVIIARCMTQSG